MTFPREVAEAIAAAVTTTLQELVSIEVSLADGSDETPWALSGPLVIATIQLRRDPPASMSLVLASDTAANLASRFLPAGTATAAEIVDDVVGEFANVIAGQVKTMLKGTAYHFDLSTPTTRRADSTRDMTISPERTACFSTEIGALVIWTDLIDAVSDSAAGSH